MAAKQVHSSSLPRQRQAVAPSEAAAAMAHSRSAAANPSNTIPPSSPTQPAPVTGCSQHHPGTVLPALMSSTHTTPRATPPAPGPTQLPVPEPRCSQHHPCARWAQFHPAPRIERGQGRSGADLAGQVWYSLDKPLPVTRIITPRPQLHAMSQHALHFTHRTRKPTRTNHTPKHR